jgi:D-alanyl-D-alanine-carboxypeptidase/D-alanyl-D-alanine-endopeptidase
LYIHPAQQATLRLWPSSEVDFFVKELDAQFTFVRDAKGFVTGLVLHQGGEDAPAPKVVP